MRAKRRRRLLQRFVWPLALLSAAGLTGLLAEASARSAQTVTLYGLIRLVGDLVMAIAVVWLVVVLVGLIRPAAPRA